jgi:glycolate oxidase FAD binding subunit
MTLRPTSPDELARAVADAHTAGTKIPNLDLSAFNRVLEHKAEDMTATVQTGITLAALQKELGTRGQWLPLDPPNAERLTVGELLSRNCSGPRRFGFGTVRDYLLGLKAVLADGRIISSGGKVVKNVAGYDLGRLFVGSEGSLGVVVEASFKLRPLSEAEKFVQADCASLVETDLLIEEVLNSDLTPVILDCTQPNRSSPLRLVLGFAGTHDEVDWQMAKAAALGFNNPSSLDYERDFWAEQGAVQTISVLPSKTVEAISTLSGARFVARAGNGVVHYRGPEAARSSSPASKLARRLKDEFDPKHILPEMPL